VIAGWSGVVCLLCGLGGRHDRAGVLLTVGLTRSREAAKGNAAGQLWSVVNCLLSPFNFLESTLYGMDAMAPSPPPPLPRFTGARGGRGAVFGVRCSVRRAAGVSLRV